MSHDHSTALVTQDAPHRNPVPNPGIVRKLFLIIFLMFLIPLY